jgi:hypothetical protein
MKNSWRKMREIFEEKWEEGGTRHQCLSFGPFFEGVKKPSRHQKVAISVSWTGFLLC